MMGDADNTYVPPGLMGQSLSMQKCGNPNKSSEDSEHMAPSAFMQQMSLTTHDRLALLTQSRTQSQRFIIQTGDASGRNDNIGFEPIPSEIVFQNFQPCEMYEIPFMLRNRDKVGRSVHVTLADSPYFKIICHGGSGQKVAPGMTVSVSVRFTAQENKDYSHELVCRTDRETFTIPIRAIGPRAVLDFPDVVQFPSVPVKHPASKTFLLRNIGRCEAKFSAHADRPFSVEPSTGLLAEGDSLQVTIQFTPSFAGDHSSWMDVSYDTGERVRVMLHGSAADANVRLDRSSVRMESTSVSRSSERTVTIHNRSGFIARYQWKPHATPQEEELQKNRFYAELENSETSELSQFMQECQVDPTMISQLPVLSRTYQHRKRIVEGDSMLFTHSAFTVSPQQGEIWPNSSADVTVTFTPRAARLCTTIAYCEVTGRESRLPLRMTGEGVGPKVQLSYDVVDVGKVFIGSRHSYEVVLANKGDIDATCSWLPSTSTFGKHFSFVPAEAVIQPKNYQSVLVVFTCSTLGEFAEEFLLAVNNCEEPLRISFKGTVIGPSFHFDKSVLDFGKVSYGFENTAIVKLFNTSLVAMKFNLRISQDEDAEFTVAPSTGSVAAQSSENIKVSLIVKNIRKYETSLVVDVDEIGSDMLALPISARSVVPVIEVVDSRVQCGRCFIGCPYRCAIQLRNCSNLPGRYSVLAQNQHLDEITYTCAEPEGEIPPLSLKAVPIVFEMKSLDSVSAIVSVQVDGVEAAPLQAKLCCIGEGPVVHCSVLSLDWGITPVLTHIKKTVTLSNESLIPAEFVAYMLRPGSVWKINPDGAVVNPRESLELTITAYLDDSVRFQDRVQIDIENGQSITIPTSAIGQGTTIVSEPPLGPVADLGYHFSNFPLSRKYRLTNRGRRHHQITWSTAGHLPVRVRGDARPVAPPPPVFAMAPTRLMLEPGESADVELVALSRRPLAAAERLLCHAIIGRCSGKERVMAVNVRAEFVSPLVAFSTKQLLFSVRLPAGGALCVQTRELVLENVSSLLLSPRLRADHPFGLVAADDETTHEMTLALEPGASRAIAVRFDPSYRDDRHSRVAESSLTVTYAQHPHVDSVALRGEVGFPNLRFERRAVDFGCVLNGTETTRRVTVTNTSPVPVSYAWSFHVDPHEPGITRARAGTPPVTRCSSPPQIVIDLADSEEDEEGEEDKGEENEEEEEKEREATGDFEQGTSVSNVADAGAAKPTKRARVAFDDVPERIPSTRMSSVCRWGGSMGASPTMQLWENVVCDNSALTIPEVFDILPLRGSLQPGESDVVTLSFFGHEDVVATALAACEVDGGPTYELQLSGAASDMCYELTGQDIDFGKQMFDQWSSAEVTLRNMGQVGFNFSVQDPENEERRDDVRSKMGISVIVPNSGFLAADDSCVFTVNFLPGVPDSFCKSVKIQVGHFEPEIVTIRCEGVFQRLTLDLPRQKTEPYQMVAEKVNHPLNTPPSELEAVEQSEVEHLLVREHALMQALQTKPKPDNVLHTNNQQCQSSVLKVKLPGYNMDLGYIVKGRVHTGGIRATNTGSFPVSFHAGRMERGRQELRVNPRRVKALPVGETVDLEITLDTSVDSVELGQYTADIPIQIPGGASLQVHLSAVVTEPRLLVSATNVRFDSVKVGERRVVTLQLHNDNMVACSWSAALGGSSRRSIDKHMPMHIKKKIRAKIPAPLMFEFAPSAGCLEPGKRLNVQVWFTPLEEKCYTEQVTLVLDESSASEYPRLRLSGQGLEPQLEFSPSVLEFAPILPNAAGIETEVKVSNPCDFPIEFYCLEMDRQYLEDEQMLRMMPEYSESPHLLLPPWEPGGKFPPEIVEYCAAKRHCLAADDPDDPDAIPCEPTPAGALSPAELAVARHVGVDASAEAQAARGRRGVAVVVHGAPTSGKTACAAALAARYSAAVISVDVTVMEAVAARATAAGRAAWEACAAASHVKKEHERELEKMVIEGFGGKVVPGSGVSTPSSRKASNLSASQVQKKVYKDSKEAAGSGKNQSAIDENAIAIDNMVAPSSQPLPILDEFGNALYSCALSESVLADILADRLQQPDCYRGVVFDSLQTLFSSHPSSTVTAVLKAINNRKHIHFLTLHFDENKLKQKQQLEWEQKEALEKQEKAAELLYLEELDEETYDALSEDARAAFDARLLAAKRERISHCRREKLERERWELEVKALEERRCEEEKLQKRKRKMTVIDQTSALTSKGSGLNRRGTVVAGDAAPPPSSAVGKRRPTTQPEPRDDAEAADGAAAAALFSEAFQPHVPPRLSAAFRAFAATLPDVVAVVDGWDRVAGANAHAVAVQPSDAALDAAAATPKKGRSATKDSPAATAPATSLGSSTEVADAAAAAATDDTASLAEPVGVPHTVVDVDDPDLSPSLLPATADGLPPPDEILDLLGIGPRGPAVPPPVTYARVPYPPERPSSAAPPPPHDNFAFVAASADDPNAPRDGATEPKDDTPPQPSVSKSRHEKTPWAAAGGATKGKAPAASRDKMKAAAEMAKEKRGGRATGGGGRSKVGRRGSGVAASPTGIAALLGSADAQGAPAVTGAACDGSEECAVAKLTSFRWVVPARAETMLRLHFASSDVGRFDETFNFELLGTHRRYPIYCRGVCCFPTIASDPKLVFSKRKRTRGENEIVHKTFIADTGVFEFGPLLSGKYRDKLKDEENSDNMACFNIVNNSMTKTEVNICFQKDVTGKTFLLEQSTPLLQPGENHITLEPGESKPVRLWAYPKSVDMEEEVLLCCVKDNPEVVRFPICCRGLRPELTIIKKMLSFDRVLLHRKETKTLYLKNQTQLPFRWKLSGQETLGEDFTFPVDSGVVEPLSEFALHVNFRAVKPSIVKKAIRIEVFDMDQILGLVQTENIQIQAEGYDVALDMTFPKGTDGGLDFSTTRVFDDSKQSCSLKNKGKYEIGFSFQWQTTDLLIDNLEEMFSVVPARGSLGPNDRPLQVSFVFRPTHVVIIKEEPILKCFIIETNLGQDGQTVACIPIKISAKSTFSRYGIVPTNDTHFGALAVGARKVKTFSIENTGEFDFKYTISKLVRIDTPIRQRALPEEARPPRSREGVGSGKRVARRDSLSSTAGTQQLGTPKPAVNKQLRPAQDLITTQSRLILGMFTIQSAFGTVYPGQQQVVNVECAPEAVGYSEEELAVNITDRNPDDYPYGIPYKLIADACVASINTTDVGDIFEEHMVCKSLAVFERFSQGRDSSGGVYCEEEGRFVFRGVTVGKKQMARFKITNISKIACDVIFSLKSTGPKQTARGQDIFEVDASRQLVAACSATYATVSFTPTSIQPYSATFEAHVEGGGKDADRVLTFEVYGDGSLPQVTVVQPSLCNKEGQPMLHFPRTLLGRSRTLTVVLKNEGTLSSKVSLDLEPDGEPFTVVPQSPPGGAARELAVGETATYNVNFAPTTAACFQTNLAVCVEDNDYENAAIVVAGDGFADDVTVELAGVVAATADARAAADAVVVDFGDCAVGAARSLAVVIANHAAAADAAVRFQWPDHALLRFSPQVGHLHAGCSKEVTLTLTCAEPRTLADERLVCRLTRLAFAAPVETVPDWDDRRRAVRWDDGGGGGGERRVVEVEPEPACTARDAAGTLDLLVSATADYARFACAAADDDDDVDAVSFRDTYVFRTRRREFSLENTGAVRLAYSWSIAPAAPPGDAIGRTSADSPLPGSATGRASTGRASVVRTPVGDMTGRTAVRTPLGGMSGRTSAEAPAPGSSVTGRAEPGSPGVGADDAAAAGVGCRVPFAVEPQDGVVSPGETVTFTASFSPLHVDFFTATAQCSIPNLADGETGPCITLRGRSLLPYCHFELDDEDATAGEADERTESAGIEPAARVVRLAAVGTNSTVCRTFATINPTNTPLRYAWESQELDSQALAQPFKCLTPKGEIDPGMTCQMKFEFTATELGQLQSRWQFVLPERDITVPFLLIGSTREPIVMFDKSHVNFKSLLVGHSATDVVQLLNEEDTPMLFSFVDASRYTPGFESHVDLAPMIGTIPPKEKLAVRLTFMPSVEGEVNFNLVCNVRRKMAPLTVNAKARGYALTAEVRCEDSSHKKVLLTDAGLNTINFGELDVKEAAVRAVYISNTGRLPLDYEFLQPTPHPSLAVDAPMGSVAPLETAACTLCFCPQGRDTLRDHRLDLKFHNGPTVRMVINGCGAVPKLEKSFTKHDFGPCFLYKLGMPAKTAVLKLTNQDTRDIGLDCLHVINGWLEVDFQAQVLPPGGSCEATFTFCPRQTCNYQSAVQFEINGLSKFTVHIKGQGVVLKVEVVDARHKTVRLGSLKIGHVVKKEVSIVNRSVAATTFHLALQPSQAALEDPQTLALSPLAEVTLKPRATCDVEVIFSPKTRIVPFSEEVALESEGVYLPLFMLMGSCQGLEVGLDTASVPFGAVVLNSQSVRTVVMHNTGDIGTKFRWDTAGFGADFSIVPLTGYVSPGMDVTFTITFHPKAVSQDIRREGLKCRIEGGRPLLLTLTGVCVSVCPWREVLSFNAHVRQKDTKSINIPNKSSTSWTLKPVIDGEQWSGAETVFVEAGHTCAYELTYLPLTMTTVDKKHAGSIFFPLPDGNGLLYNVSGLADQPRCSGKIQREVPCKTSYTELLRVNNWLSRAQRFKVTIESQKLERLESTTIKGLDYIDVPGNSKDYKLNFYAYKEGTATVKVMFRNEKTGEYQWYEVSFRATRPGYIGTVQLSTAARRGLAHALTLENPLPGTSTFTASCALPEVLMPAQLSVPPLSEGHFRFEYLPIKQGEVTGKLELTSADLGQYLYELKLTCTAPLPESPVHFSTCLGSHQVLPIRFLNFTRQKSDYQCKVNNGDFSVDKSVMAAPGSAVGTEVTLDALYEPSQIGETHALLTISSPVGGEYTFPLVGTCLPPRPQGPITVKAGPSSSIVFRNVLPAATTFAFVVDKPCFSVGRTSDTIRPRRDHKIMLSFDASQAKAPVTGKLTVMTVQSAGSGGGSSNISWVYYLRGVPV